MSESSPSLPLPSAGEEVGLVADFVLECRGRGGLFLTSKDLNIIRKWISTSRSLNSLLLILEDTLPAYYSKHATRTVPPSLTGVNRRVLRQLGDLSARAVLF